MNTVIFRPLFEDDSLDSLKNRKLGAKVFGLPVSKEVGSYLDEVYLDVSRQRMVNMYFAGEFNGIVDYQDTEEENY